MATKKKQTLAILKITEYKGSNILIQHVVPGHVFQAIIFRDGQFYQVHEIYTPEEGQTKLTDQQIEFCGATILQYAYQVADRLLEIANPQVEIPAKQENSPMPKGIKAD